MKNRCLRPTKWRQLVLLWLLSVFSASSSGDELDEVMISNKNTTTTASNSTSNITNPYYSGCLRQNLPEWHKLRVCTRIDPPEAVGIVCQESAFPSTYMEIRIATGNWDSATALGWLTQIVLSEILGVPSSIEAGGFGTSRDFYDPQEAINYDHSNSAQPLVTSTDLPDGDCRSLTANRQDDYQPCGHFMPEFWGVPYEAIRDQKVEPPQGIGILGQESWFLSKFAAADDPSLVSYHGLLGETNRQKLAAAFKRPTTWSDYCELVSEDNCTTPSNISQRAPRNEMEATRMFVEGEYTGHFRYTDKNNCTKYPLNCTGHIANYPCGWKSYMEANIYHLEISLDPHNGEDDTPGGYTTEQLNDMWHAANATREPLIMMWWTPEPLVQKFVGSDAEFQRVLLKPYTLECEQGRKNVSELSEECSPDLYTRVGDPEGACDSPPEPLRKLISAGLFDHVNSPDIPDAARSPAYDMLRLFQISEIQLGELFNLIESKPTRRDAVCKWAADNLGVLNATVPHSYPRITRKEPPSTLGYVALAIGSLATLTIVITAAMVYQKRNKASVQFAQLDFLSLLLAGSLLVSIGSILAALPASDGTCLSTVWFVYIGYTLELVPLIVKVAAINTMMEAARTLRRVTLSRKQLYSTVAVIGVCLVVFLATWSALDPPKQETEYFLTDEKTDLGETIVGLTFFCKADSNVWQYLAVGWNVILLLGATVLAFQTRNTIKSFNESRTLAFLIYSHFVFVILRLSTFLLSNDVKGSILYSVRSLLYASDQITTCGIYFLPKLTSQDRLEGNDSLARSVMFAGLQQSGTSNSIGFQIAGQLSPSGAFRPASAANSHSAGTSVEFKTEDFGNGTDNGGHASRGNVNKTGMGYGGDKAYGTEEALPKIVDDEISEVQSLQREDGEDATDKPPTAKGEQ